MSDPFLVPIVVAITITSLVLVAGLFTLMRPFLTAGTAAGGRPAMSRSNQLMRARVLAQAVAVMLILAGAAWKKAHHSTAPVEAGARTTVTLAHAPVLTSADQSGTRAGERAP